MTTTVSYFEQAYEYLNLEWYLNQEYGELVEGLSAVPTLALDILKEVPSHLAYATQKGVTALLTGRAFYILPTAIATYGAYEGTRYLSMAAIGTNSLAHRKKLVSEAFSSKDLSVFGRIGQIRDAAFGTLTLKQRIENLKWSMGAYGVSLAFLYAMHAYTNQDPTSNAAKSTQEFMSGTRRSIYTEGATAAENELNPKQFDYDKRTYALNVLTGSYKASQTLSKPLTAESSSEVQAAVHLADQIFQPSAHKTPLEEQTGGIWDSICSKTSLFCQTAPKSTEAMSADELQDAYLFAREKIIAGAPTDYDTTIASGVGRVCNMTYGFFNSEACDGLKESVQRSGTSPLDYQLSQLDEAYALLRQRAILHERIPFVDTPQMQSDYRAIHARNTGTTAEVPIDQVLKLVNEQIANGAGLRSASNVPFHNEWSVWSLENMNRLEAGLKQLVPENMDKFDSEGLPLIKQAAAKFFGLETDFTLSEYKKAYKKVSLAHHPDRSSGEKHETIFRISQIFNGILKESRAYGDNAAKEWNGLLPMPTTVVTDLMTQAADWYNNPNI